MKIKFFIFMLLLSYFKLFAQTSYDKYNWLIYVAMLEKKNSNFEKAKKHFEKAFKYKSPQGATDILNYAVVNLKLNKKSKTIKLIKESIIKYRAPIDYIISFKEFKELENNNSYKNIINNYNSFENKFYKKLDNPSVYYSIQSLLTKDQLVRETVDYVSKGEYFISNNKKSEYEYAIINKQDSLNINEFIQITKKHGYLSYGWVLLWHHRGDKYIKNNYVWQFFKPFISKEIEKGNIERSFFTQFDDEALMFESGGQYQIYGNFQGVEIKDIENVDLRRIEFGLPPLYYDYLIYGSTLPSNYIVNEKKFYEIMYSKIRGL